MTKQEFLQRLNRLLADVTPEEREEALRYYEEYFDEAGPEQEQAVLAELGSPEKVAAIIKANVPGSRIPPRYQAPGAGQAVVVKIPGDDPLPRPGRFLLDGCDQRFLRGHLRERHLEQGVGHLGEMAVGVEKGRQQRRAVEGNRLSLGRERRKGGKVPQGGDFAVLHQHRPGLGSGHGDNLAVIKEQGLVHDMISFPKVGCPVFSTPCRFSCKGRGEMVY